jgi:hypothetical protein
MVALSCLGLRLPVAGFSVVVFFPAFPFIAGIRAFGFSLLGIFLVKRSVDAAGSSSKLILSVAGCVSEDDRPLLPYRLVAGGCFAGRGLAMILVVG